MEKSLIPGLDTFRFFAFFAVYLFHTNLLGCGYLGVQAFFVLSGFLLIPILIEMRQELDTKTYFIVFYARRALRIFPLYYGYLIVLLLVLFIVHFILKVNTNSLLLIKTQIVYALTYTSNFFHATTAFKTSYFLSHFWSLAVEEQFYLVWPFIIWFFSGYKLKNILLFIICFGPFLRLFVYSLSIYQLIPYISSNPNDVVYYSLISHIDAFATGGFFACFIKKINSKLAWIGIIGSFCLGLGSDYIETNQIDLFSFGYPEFMLGSFKFFWGYSVWNFSFAFILCALSTNQFLPSIFNNPVLQSLGKRSYGMYVFHFPVLDLLKYWIPPSDFLWVASLSTTIGLSYLSYSFYEKPFLKLKDRLFPKDQLADFSGQSTPSIHKP